MRRPSTTTGSPLPPGADTVAILEVVQRDGNRVRIPGDVAPGANVRNAGEDVRAGEVVLRAGQVLSPVRTSLAAALGLDALQVARRPTVAVFTTGDELVPPGLPLAQQPWLASVWRKSKREPQAIASVP